MFTIEIKYISNSIIHSYVTLKNQLLYSATITAVLQIESKEVSYTKWINYERYLPLSIKLTANLLANQKYETMSIPYLDVKL